LCKEWVNRRSLKITCIPHSWIIIVYWKAPSHGSDTAREICHPLNWTPPGVLYGCLCTWVLSEVQNHSVLYFPKYPSTRGSTERSGTFCTWPSTRVLWQQKKAITNMHAQLHTNGSAQMQYCAVVDEGNFVRLGRFNSTCISAKTHLEAQEAIPW